MTPEAFAYWLQGFSELNPGGQPPNAQQWQMIQEHLATVFTKVTPELSPLLPRPRPPFLSPTTIMC